MKPLFRQQQRSVAGNLLVVTLSALGLAVVVDELEDAVQAHYEAQLLTACREHQAVRIQGEVYRCEVSDSGILFEKSLQGPY